MRKSIFATVLLGLLLADFAQAALPVIDRTDKVHSRRYLDSLNVYNRRSIRVNQSGFRPQDYKYAYVADPKEMTFKVIDANTGKEVSGGGNLSLIKKGLNISVDAFIPEHKVDAYGSGAHLVHALVALGSPCDGHVLV